MAKRKFSSVAEAQKLNPVDVVGILNGVGIDLTDVATNVAKPLISLLFDKIKEAIANAGKNKPNSAKNVRLRIAALEAQNQLQKELNKLTEARLAALEAAK